jgi:hypothetical protein
MWGSQWTGFFRHRLVYEPIHETVHTLPIHKFGFRYYIAREFMRWGEGPDYVEIVNDAPPWTTWFYFSDWFDTKSRFSDLNALKEWRRMHYADWTLMPENTKLSIITGGYAHILAQSAKQGGWGLSNGDFAIIEPFWSFSKKNTTYRDRPWTKCNITFPWMGKGDVSYTGTDPSTEHPLAYPFFHCPRPRIFNADTPGRGSVWVNQTAKFNERGTLWHQIPDQLFWLKYSMSLGPYLLWRNAKQFKWIWERFTILGVNMDWVKWIEERKVRRYYRSKPTLLWMAKWWDILGRQGTFPRQLTAFEMNFRLRKEIEDKLIYPEFPEWVDQGCNPDPYFDRLAQWWPFTKLRFYEDYGNHFRYRLFKFPYRRTIAYIVSEPWRHSGGYIDTRFIEPGQTRYSFPFFMNWNQYPYLGFYADIPCYDHWHQWPFDQWPLCDDRGYSTRTGMLEPAYQNRYENDNSVFSNRHFFEDVFTQKVTGYNIYTGYRGYRYYEDGYKTRSFTLWRKLGIIRFLASWYTEYYNKHTDYLAGLGRYYLDWQEMRGVHWMPFVYFGPETEEYNREYNPFLVKYIVPEWGNRTWFKWSDVFMKGAHNWWWVSICRYRILRHRRSLYPRPDYTPKVTATNIKGYKWYKFEPWFKWNPPYKWVEKALRYKLSINLAQKYPIFRRWRRFALSWLMQDWNKVINYWMARVPFVSGDMGFRWFGKGPITLLIRLIQQRMEYWAQAGRFEYWDRLTLASVWLTGWPNEHMGFPHGLDWIEQIRGLTLWSAAKQTFILQHLFFPFWWSKRDNIWGSYHELIKPAAPDYFDSYLESRIEFTRNPYWEYHAPDTALDLYYLVTKRITRVMPRPMKFWSDYNQMFFRIGGGNPGDWRNTFNSYPCYATKWRAPNYPFPMDAPVWLTDKDNARYNCYDKGLFAVPRLVWKGRFYNQSPLLRLMCQKTEFYAAARGFWFGHKPAVPFIPAVLDSHNTFRRALFDKGLSPSYTEYMPWLPMFNGHYLGFSVLMRDDDDFTTNWSLRTLYRIRELGLRHRCVDYRIAAWLTGGTIARRPAHVFVTPPSFELFGLGGPNHRKYPFLFSPSSEIINAHTDSMVMCGLSFIS